MNITDNGTFPTTAQSGTGDAFFKIEPGKNHIVDIFGATFDSGSINVQVLAEGSWHTLATKGAITEAEGFQFVTNGAAVRFVVTSVAAAGADIDIYLREVV